jgi:predicted DNA-binding transcriptional regulator YafY
MNWRNKNVKEFFSEDKITMNSDGSAIVKFVSPDEEGLKKYILSFGLDCTVLEPDHLRNELRDYIEKLYEAYNSEVNPK